MDPENLRAVPLFSQMAQEDLQRIATFAAEDSAPAGTTLVREGDFSNDMVAIESGTADVVRGGETIGTLGPGDVFGEIGVLGGETRTATIVATSAMRLVRLTSWEVKRLPREVRDRLAELVESRRAAGRADSATPG
jgi:CRP/FNR family transcriptional regulator, cyclic AMP receptor protein